jgi:aspartate/methionine/tyrosine aminotransferase
VPGTAPHPSVLAALAAVSGTHEAAKYGPILGEPAMRAALAAELRHMYGLKEEGIMAEDVGITTGCNMAFLVLLM